jgi:N-acyl-D-amino-acid deacylase
MTHGDLLIRGGDVIDGSGAPAARADVRVRGGRIVGAVVTPGFIDTHAHTHPQVFWDWE